MSVEAVHEILMIFALTGVAVRPVGTDGAVVSGGGRVVAEAEADFADWLFAASTAATVEECVEEAARPVSLNVNALLTVAIAVAPPSRKIL